MRWILVCLLAASMCVTAASAARAERILVPKGGDLQAAIDRAKPGDVIALEPDATYVGNFILRNKGAIADYITIRSAAADAALPANGVRMTPDKASRLPKIRSADETPAIQTETAANHWKLMFLEFQANQQGSRDIIALGAGDITQTQLSQVPYALVLDRVYVHGDPVIGQKRGIALHSRDTTIVNSWVSECKAIGQEAQAISGFNGPGNYLIENNHLEGASQNFLLGGADPVIPNLVTSHVTFRYNHLTKPLTWRDPIVAPPTGVTAAAVPGAGALAAGTYFYTVQARVPVGQTKIAISKQSVEVSATISAGTTGAVVISWRPVDGAQEYVVWGRTTGKPTMNWTAATPSFTDSGIAGTSGSPAVGTQWLVKNIFELKNAQDVTVEGNVFEHNWVAGQPGIAILFTPRNQDGHAPWAVVQDVRFRYNIVRHTAGAVSILGIDNINGASQRTNHISVTNNVFDDISNAWGSGGRIFQSGDGPDSVTIDHNTSFGNVTTTVWFYGAPTTNFVYTNNMSPHNAYGITGSGSSIGKGAIGQYAPNADICANVLAGGSAKAYPACSFHASFTNYFPPTAEWLAGFRNQANGDYHLLPGFVAKYPSLDGPDIGADIVKIETMTAVATSGDNRGTPSIGCRIVSARNGGPMLPDGVMNQPYAELVTCVGGSASQPFVWRQTASSPLEAAGLRFDPVAAIISGTPTSDVEGSFTLEASDPMNAARVVTGEVTLKIVLPELRIDLPAPPVGNVGAQYRLVPTVTGAVGTTTWTIVGLPIGLSYNSTSGAIGGIPAAWGSFAVDVRVRDSRGRERQQPATIVIKPAPIVIIPVTLPNGRQNTMYSVALTAAGGTGNPTWSARGQLPGGIVVHESGTLSGVPTLSGTFQFTVTATDRIYPDNTATMPLTLTIAPPRDIVLYASDATVIGGAWFVTADATAAGGKRLWNPDAGAAKLTAALASPVNYFELTFSAEAGVPYHLWMRGKADKNSWANDSIHVQFSGSVDANRTAINRIGGTSGAVVSIEDGTNAGLIDWGWADNAYSGFGDPVYFASTGAQTIRVQVREDGVSLDQIVLSADRYLTIAPGATKRDATILPR